ncbi:glycosyltransferase family 2 protein [Hyunsoonleella pacifica]|uniref:Glycosyltransferase n=1 Tax=Hyunsoonleella pacifica TaxID=1080224 RepID=A0A4Q9FQI5_9FLAO|nr:glycosyltransferase [Hyunsoonleella pacifica]TBN17620.1 glycosyltransferase [Hyunsoonleella pacifica]GGD10375.1 hypothetical protein GCM10011368_10440 [Hyunsoonleella pacifica]
MNLSIIIPVYNVEKYIKRCLDSLIHQEFSNYEVLVIDDGSKDASVKIAKDYSDRYSFIKVISKENGGVGSARNKGIDIATGKYLYFLDPDDYIAYFTLKKIFYLSEKYNLDVLTFGTVATLSSDLNDSKNTNEEDFNLSVLTGKEYIAKNFYKNEVWWYLVKKEFLDKSSVRFIEGRWMEDAIFTVNLFIRAKRMAKIPMDIHRHVVTPQSAMTNKEPEHYLGVIRDNANAAVVFKDVISSVNQDDLYSRACITRLKTRQQSFVFFMMVRMLKSRIKLNEVKIILNQVKEANAYPLKDFIGEDYNNLTYRILVFLFNSEATFYLLFRMFNPILKKV